jgi:hypothetical protein
MVAQDVIFSDFELQVEDVEVFSFGATNVPLAENRGSQIDNTTSDTATKLHSKSWSSASLEELLGLHLVCCSPNYLRKVHMDQWSRRIVKEIRQVWLRAQNDCTPLTAQ